MTTPADPKAPLSFEEMVAALLDEEHLLPIQVHYRLSGLEGEEAQRFMEIWPQISLRRRQALLEELEVLTEHDLTLDYRAVGLAALSDAAPQIRQLGIRLLWEEEDPSLAERFLQLLREDPDPHVRAAAAGALGTYVYLGEVDELAPALFRRIRDTLLALCQNPAQEEEIRRRALEAVSFATHPVVPDLIAAAYAQGQVAWQISALFAMGRSADPRWAETVMRHLQDPNPALRAEAATAAGNLALAQAVPTLLELLEDPLPEVRMAAAWALGEIGKGSDQVRQALQRALANAQDDDEAAMIRDALDNFDFNAGSSEMLLLDIGEEDWSEEDVLALLAEEDFGFTDEPEDAEDGRGTDAAPPA